MKILIVEDEEKLAEAIKVGLKQHGFTADIVDTGPRGESRIITCRGDYDAVILDLMLPEKSGFDVCRSVREAGVNTPILILTARTALEDKVLALNSGADDYLVKPFAFSELLARIRALLRRPKETLPQILTVKDVTLNPQTREVKRGGTTIDLSLKEFELLHLLMRNHNQVMGREDIFVHLWDFADTSASNVIDAHIKNLRKKLNAGESKENILETVRGVGYTIKS